MLLKPGDTASIIAPASQFRGADRHYLEDAATMLESWGLNVVLRVDPGHHFYLAGSDEVRGAHLQAALTDSETKVIFCTRGGYGSPRLLPFLDRLSPPSPRLLVGYSDVTSLHLAVGRLWPQIELLHGPNVATAQLLGPTTACEENRAALRAALFSPEIEIDEEIDFLRAGHAQGELIGGCLSLVASSCGTRFQPETAGKIVFLEDTGEPPYRIDRMLMQMKLSGCFDQVQGVVFGVMRGCTDPYNDLKEVILGLFEGAQFPIGFGLRSGHGDSNLPLRLGMHAALDSSKGRFVQPRQTT
jgi:muramoyltetrapeptide carboxypeptidase